MTPGDGVVEDTARVLTGCIAAGTDVRGGRGGWVLASNKGPCPATPTITPGDRIIEDTAGVLTGFIAADTDARRRGVSRYQKAVSWYTYRHPRRWRR